MSVADSGRLAWRLQWEHGSAEVQALGGMLGPVTFRLGEERELDVMHVAPWAGMTRASALPGLMRRLRGEWPCVPFGRTDLPPDLPAGWQPRDPGDTWPHGYAANHRWECVSATPTRVHLAIEYPADSPVSRIERVIEAAADAPALEITLTVHARYAGRMPAGLHPTFRLPPAPGRVRVLLGGHEGIYSYPASPAGAVSRLVPDARSEDLSAMAGVDGALDLSRLPLAVAGEELVQVKGIHGAADRAPLTLHYLDYDACVGLWWDTAQLPDLMLWISNGGRIHFPWMSRHLALGAEPVNGQFDLGRVASAPQDHPLASRTGIALDPAQPWTTRYRIAAWPQT
jgi:hypothetical protein